MISVRELLRAHVGALFTLDASGRLVRANESDGKPAPRFFLGRTEDGCEWWVRHDLAAGVLEELEAAVDALPPGMETDASPEVATAFQAILQRSEPVQATWSGPAFCFPEHLTQSPQAVPIGRTNAELLRPLLDGWCEDVYEGKTVCAVILDGQAVSVCASVRESPIAHEAGVETAVAFRGRGYAQQVVSAWAMAVRKQNVIPLYSTSWANGASRSVARKLGLTQFASDLHIR